MKALKEKYDQKVKLIEEENYKLVSENDSIGKLYDTITSEND